MSSKTEFDDVEIIALTRLDIERGDLAAALARIKTVLAGKRPPLAAKSIAARLYAQLGLLEHAQKYFEELLQQDQVDDLDLFQLGMTHFEQGDFSKALHYWEQVLTHQPHFPPALYYKSLAQIEQNQLAEGQSQLERLLQVVQPDNLYFERAKSVLAQLRQKSSSGFTAQTLAANIEH